MQDAYTASVEGQIYYLNKSAVPAFEDKGVLNYITGYGENDRANRGLSTKTKYKAVIAPQTVLAKQVVKEIDGITSDGWLTFTEKIVSHLLKAPASDSELAIDPCLRYLLLLRTVDMAAEGHAILHEEIAKYREQLADPDFDVSVRWMDPKDTEAHKARLRAEKKLRGTTWIGRAWEEARKREQDLKASFQDSVESIGWLDLDRQGSWTLRTSWQPNDAVALEIITPGESGDECQWKVIGTASPTEIRMSPATDGTTLQQGRLVFIRKQRDRK